MLTSEELFPPEYCFVGSCSSHLALGLLPLPSSSSRSVAFSRPSSPPSPPSHLPPDDIVLTRLGSAICSSRPSARRGARGEPASSPSSYPPSPPMLPFSAEHSRGAWSRRGCARLKKNPRCQFRNCFVVAARERGEPSGNGPERRSEVVDCGNNGIRRAAIEMLWARAWLPRYPVRVFRRKNYVRCTPLCLAN